MSKATVKKQVEYCLLVSPETRNSDITLMQTLWRYYYPEKMHTDSKGEDMVYVKDLFELPREDHIKRIRANIQNVERRYLPTDFEVMKKRKDADKSWRAYLGYDLPNNVWHRHCENDAELKKQLERALQSEGVSIAPKQATFL